MMGLKPTTVKTTMTAKKTKKAQMQARRLKLRMSTLRFVSRHVLHFRMMTVPSCLLFTAGCVCQL